MIKKICVEKWIDALREPTDGYDFQEEPELKYYDSDLEELEYQTSFKESKAEIGIISTPMGLLPLTEHSLASKFFNFWVVHTNFAVTVQMILQVADIDGIEDIMPITKHRFRISVGRMFKLHDVVDKINKLLCGNLDNLEQSLYMDIEKIKNKISSDKYWIVYAMPNGDIFYASSNEDNIDFMKKYEEYNNTFNEFGGILGTYENKELITR